MGSSLTAEELRRKRAEYMREYRRKNPERVRATEKAGRVRNRDKLLKRKAAYRKRYAAEIRSYNAAYQDRNAEASRVWRRRWAKDHPEVYRAARANRRAREMDPMPPWVDADAIQAIYAERERIVRETGVKHHVDHIYPLQGKNVCGLHVPWNLQIITAAENCRKSNRVPEFVS